MTGAFTKTFMHCILTSCTVILIDIYCLALVSVSFKKISFLEARKLENETFRLTARLQNVHNWKKDCENEWIFMKFF